MEALVPAFSAASLLPRISARNPGLIFATGFPSPRVRKSVIVGAKKKKNKPDTHSFVPKPDEATGPFPEAVLLRERKTQEDGKLLPEFADAEEAELFEYLQLQMESDLDTERMRHYEVVYLIHEDQAEEVANVNEKIIDFMREKRGKIWRLNDWGLRRLAYKIKKAKNAHYMLMNFELEAKWINDFKSMLDKDERIIRHLVMKRDNAETKDCPPPPEFHTLQAGLDDEDDYIDDDDENEANLDGQVWDDEDEPSLDGYDDINVDDDIVAVDDNNNDVAKGNDRSSGVSISGSRGPKAYEKVHR